MLYDGRVWLCLVMYVVDDVVVYLDHYLQVLYDGRVWLCLVMLLTTSDTTFRGMWSVMLSSSVSSFCLLPVLNYVN